MALVRTEPCTRCGRPHVVVRGDRYDHPLGHRCAACEQASRRRLELGDGDAADRWLHLLYPADFAQEQRARPAAR